MGLSVSFGGSLKLSFDLAKKRAAAAATVCPGRPMTGMPPKLYTGGRRRSELAEWYQALFHAELRSAVSSGAGPCGPLAFSREGYRICFAVLQFWSGPGRRCGRRDGLRADHPHHPGRLDHSGRGSQILDDETPGEISEPGQDLQDRMVAVQRHLADDVRHAGRRTRLRDAGRRCRSRRAWRPAISRCT